MKVLHTIPGIAQESSGPSYSVTKLVQGLRDQKVDATIATLRWSTEESNDGVIFYFPLGLGPAKLGRSPKMLGWIREKVKRGQIDLFHNHGMWQFNALYAAWLGRSNNIPVVISTRGALSSWAMANGSRLKKVFWGLFQRRALTRATCFHATSQQEYEQIRALGFTQPVAVIPNGITLPKTFRQCFKDTGEQGSFESRRVLFLGRLHPVKGLEKLLYVWSALHKKYNNYELVIAGDDTGYYGASGYRDKLKALSKRLECDRVRFVGRVEGDRKFELYASSDIYILPSESENFAVTVAEALSCGTPVIASHGTPWAQLNQKDCGWWTMNDTDSLRDVLDAAMSMDSSELIRMGKNGQRWMQDEFDWESISIKMRSTYEWVVAPQNSHPEWIFLD